MPRSPAFVLRRVFVSSLVVAVPFAACDRRGAGVQAGSLVTIHSWGVRKDFYSRRLDRSFPELELASVSPLVGAAAR